MLQAYKAVIRGNQIEWQDETPAALTSNQAVPVIVTFLEEPTPAPQPNDIGAKMAAILEELAQLGGVTSIDDPLAWEREMRTSDTLPDRK